MDRRFRQHSGTGVSYPASLGSAVRRARSNVRIVVAMCRQQTRSLTTRASVVDPAGRAEVSLTSFGKRVSFVHLAIESIGAGQARPRRLVLWLDDPALVERPTRALRRLRRRGLEIQLTEDLGPHKKWYPMTMLTGPDLPLVTADDDTIYPIAWLAELLSAHDDNPDEVMAHRARRIHFDALNRIRPYAEWPSERSRGSAYSTVAIGVGGVLYPPPARAAMRAAGDGFRGVAPRADDIWLHAVKVRAGIRTRALGSISETAFIPVRGARSGGLLDHNVNGGGNDEQIASTFDGLVLSRMQDEVARPQP